MLYPKNSAETLDKGLFQDPTCEYRGTPFWAWNCALDKEELLWQIGILKQMGLGGFHMHSRDGMATPYLSDEFMDLVRACVDKAKEEDMLAWLYDEDRWPSGSAGGLLTKDPKYRGRRLICTTQRQDDAVDLARAIAEGLPYFLACYDICLNDKGELAHYAKVGETDPVQGKRWYIYVHPTWACGWYNNQAYVDTLSKEAIDGFIALTYQGYKDAVGDAFGTTIPAIFTDEPQFSYKESLNFAHSDMQLSLPWTADFGDTFTAQYGYSIVDKLPEIIWQLPNNAVSQARYHYHDHITHRFVTAFADNCGAWCEQNHIALTGHLLSEATLHGQTAVVGDCMRSYRSFQLPGIDLLRDHFEYTTAKQAQSAVRQYGREGMVSELYGVTNWDFDFRGFKLQGDWQAALGVTVRVPHLSWVSMGGEAKRDYPPCINYQSPWYKEFPYIEDHFARLNTALTRGNAVVKVGVVHPVESYWLHFGPSKETEDVRGELDRHHADLSEWLLFGQIDFDYICESTLPDQYQKRAQGFGVGEMTYSTIVVPGCHTLRRTTFERLKEFHNQGGNLIFIGDCPQYIDAFPTNEVAELYNTCTHIPFSKAQVLQAVESERILDLFNTEGPRVQEAGFLWMNMPGTRTDNYIYQMREDKDCNWLFIAKAKRNRCVDIVRPQPVLLTVYGEYTPVLWDTLTGEIKSVEYRLENGNTLIPNILYEQDSLLYQLLPKQVQAQKATPTTVTVTETLYTMETVPYTLSEPNALLLDMAEYAFDDGAFYPTEEVLCAADICRGLAGLEKRSSGFAQPWVTPELPPEHTITLRFTIHSEIDVPAPLLAIENAAKCDITWNGTPVTSKVQGYYIDKAIQTLPLPAVRRGENTLVVRIPFGNRTAIEWCYLLGDFHVKLQGAHKTIVASTPTIGFASIVHQGLPFYGGNITYHTTVDLAQDSLVRIRANSYRGTLMRVAVDGNDCGVIAFSPYALDVMQLSKGTHTIDYTLFGNRRNSNGPLHLADLDDRWIGPAAWHAVGDRWSYEYNLSPIGITASPKVELVEQHKK